MILQRNGDGIGCTLGTLTTDDGTFFAVCLELPWADNQPDLSCVPAGEYTAKRRYSAHHGYEVFGLLDVPNRSDIEIHSGNHASDSLGCLLIGTSFGADNESIEQSKIAFAKLMTTFQGVDQFPLTIRNP